MAREPVEIKEFAGLHLQANSFSSVPEGAMEVAENIVLSKDKKIEKCRGFYQYHDASANTPVSLFAFQDRLLLANTDSIGYFTDTGSDPNKTGNKTLNTGLTIDIAAARPSRSAEMANNLYFTTEDGVRKLEAYNGPVMLAGVPPGLDLNMVENLAGGVALSATSAVMYRILFGRRDANGTTYLGAPSDVLLIENPTGGSVDPVIEFSIPEEITTAGVSAGFFFRVYRSQQVTPNTATPLSDFALIPSERPLTDAELTAGVVIFRDTVFGSTVAADDFFRGALLYTNEDSREGESKANTTPPLCEDIVEYKNHLIYAKVTGVHRFYLDVIEPINLVDASSTLEFKVGANTYVFVAKKGAGNKTLQATCVTVATTTTITYASHNFSNGFVVYISNAGTIPSDLYTISNRTANTFDITHANGVSATSCYFEGRTDGTNPIFFFDEVSVSINDIDIRVDATAVHILKAINRSSAPLYGKYLTTPTSTGIGKMLIYGQGFGDQIQVRETNTASRVFDPDLTGNFSDNVSDNDDLPNALMASKINEPEAVPLDQIFPIGPKSKVIQRVFALRDSVVILKEEGVFRLTGDTVTQFSIAPLDKTIFCVAPKSAAAINNSVIFLSNQGFAMVTESSVSIISRPIEAALTPIIGNANLSQETVGAAYESERHYIVSTLGPNDSTATRVYVYNYVTDTWVTWTNTFTAGVVGPNDTLYLINTDQVVRKERKFHTKLDYCGQNYTITVNSAATNIANISTGALVPESGDVIVKNNIINRIVRSTPNGATYDVEFLQDSNLADLDSVILYDQYTAKITMVPYHGGKVGVSKRFSEMQIHLSEPSISAIDIAFQGAYFGGSEVTDWTKTAVIESASGGWGNEPWGFFPWGQDDVIDILTGTQSSAIIRLYIPRFQGRGTYIQPILEHRQAGERMSIQAIAFTVRGYGERTTK